MFASHQFHCVEGTMTPPIKQAILVPLALYCLAIDCEFKEAIEDDLNVRNRYI